MKKSIIYIFTFSLILAFSACGKFYKLEKSTNWEELYEAANKYYEKGEYNKAIILYDRVLPVIRGSERAELADFNYAYSHFRTKRYIEAAGYFNTFYQTYSRSPMAEEAMFMNAYSLYLDAPDYNLDQKSSKDAVNAIQLFINKFPQSDSYERAMGMIDDLQRRFEEKAYKESSMYLRLTEGLFPGDFYRACIINFQNFAKNYPDSKYNEELAFRLVDVSFSYAERSNFDKKEDRLKDAIKFAEQFKRKYPESKYLSQVDALSLKTTKEYDKFIVMKKEYDERLAKYKEEEAARAVSIEGEEVRTIPLTETNN
ncbi:outer membrane protein assembly factor BamD [Belliella sp. DSM 111904]|uniref:Outer membrane protein assembly factor BamD n=1 Tax=Belliella filtrata TaxID=2923435 RepID=A0ABS9UXT3_9BACT|nr:outer membrane protein assembly factor BamD [Belliella filtrata]MCH7408883.1 outer membrane protein assembly factor BamD [Belliella filtrata]